MPLSLKFTKVRSERLTVPSVLHSNNPWKQALACWYDSSDGLVFYALMCGSVAALDSYAKFRNLEREAIPTALEAEVVK